LDPWGLVEPRAARLTVILIAAIGFANYLLLKLYGARGVELAGFLGGLVNSTLTVTELATRSRETGGRLADVAYRGVLLSTAAMALRKALCSRSSRQGSHLALPGAGLERSRP